MSARQELESMLVLEALNELYRQHLRAERREKKQRAQETEARIASLNRIGVYLVEQRQRARAERCRPSL